MEEEVNTRGLEIKILEAKTNKLVEEVNDLSSKMKSKEIDIIEAISRFEKLRKELVDCVVLQLGTPTIGPLVAIATIKVISQIDDVMLDLKLRSAFNMGL